MGDRMGSSPIDRTKKMTCTFIVQVFFLQGSKGLERDVKKTARCAVLAIATGICPESSNQTIKTNNLLFAAARKVCYTLLIRKGE